MIQPMFWRAEELLRAELFTNAGPSSTSLHVHVCKPLSHMHFELLQNLFTQITPQSQGHRSEAKFTSQMNFKLVHKVTDTLFILCAVLQPFPGRPLFHLELSPSVRLRGSANDIETILY